MSDLHEFTPQEQEWVDQFLSETTLFLGPDPEIIPADANRLSGG